MCGHGRDDKGALKKAGPPLALQPGGCTAYEAATAPRNAARSPPVVGISAKSGRGQRQRRWRLTGRRRDSSARLDWTPVRLVWPSKRIIDRSSVERSTGDMHPRAVTTLRHAADR